ncbi:MAG TPA: hypothetical protein VKA27_09525, partial [Sunxiuqinia sp.]|nr:hypothetical protein [Sunxiuqinia sp.]
GEGVYSNKAVFNNYTSTLLAAQAFTPTPFSKTMFLRKYRANKYLAAGLKTIIQLNNQLHFRLEGYGFAPVRRINEVGNLTAAYDPEQFSTLKFMGMGGFVYQSALGPLSFTINYFEKSNPQFYVALSFGFVMFNNRGY